MSGSRDEFPPKVKNQLAMRAHFICSNPDCRATTLAPSEADESRFIYTGRAAHIHSAAGRGSRPNSSLTPEERSSIGNGVFLCAICADMVDDNNGLDYPSETLRAWKAQHDEWVRSNLNKEIDREPATGVHFNSTVSSSQQVAEFMRQGGEELVFRPVFGLQLSLLILGVHGVDFGAAARGEHGTGQSADDRPLYEKMVSRSQSAGSCTLKDQAGGKKK
jgi:hypothetical protein